MSRDPEDVLRFVQDQLDLSPIEYRLIAAVANHPLPGPTACDLKRRFDPDHAKGEPSTFDAGEAERSLVRLMKRDLVQTLTSRTLDEIRDFMTRDESTLFDVMPEPGWVDFTWKGAVLWRGLDAVLNGRKSYWLVTNLLGPIDGLECVDVVGTDRCDVERILEEQRQEAESLHSAVDVQGPDRIGRWREPWWRLFAEGYHARVYFAPDEVASTVRVGQWA